MIVVKFMGGTLVVTLAEVSQGSVLRLNMACPQVWVARAATNVHRILSGAPALT